MIKLKNANFVIIKENSIFSHQYYVKVGKYLHRPGRYNIIQYTIFHGKKNDFNQF
jgi:hypothetical protein